MEGKFYASFRVYSQLVCIQSNPQVAWELMLVCTLLGLVRVLMLVEKQNDNSVLKVKVTLQAGRTILIVIKTLFLGI